MSRALSSSLHLSAIVSLLGCVPTSDAPAPQAKSDDDSSAADTSPVKPAPESASVASEPAPAQPEAAPVEPEPEQAAVPASNEPSGAFAFEQVYSLERQESDAPDHWALEMVVSVGEADEDLLNDHDGVDKSLDASHAHIYAPLALGQAATMVTHGGLTRGKISGFGLYRGMDDDVVTAILGRVADDDDSSGGLAILGAVQPVDGARLRDIASEAPSAELLETLRRDYALVKAKAVAEFEPILEESGREMADGIELEASCVRQYTGLKLPASVTSIVAIECGGKEVYDPRVSALLMLDAKGQPHDLGGGQAAWSIDFGSSTVHAAVDLDGDGVDELLVQDAGYEYFAERAVAWDGKAYVTFPKP